MAELEAELATTPFPASAALAWSAWARIRRRKGGGFSGPMPIEWTDIDAFVRRSGAVLTPSDLDLIEMLDDAYLEAQAEQASERDQQQAIRDGLKSVEPDGRRAR